MLETKVKFKLNHEDKTLSISTCAKSRENDLLAEFIWLLVHKAAGLKRRSQVTGQATGHRSGYRPQITGHRSGHRSGYRPQVTNKTIGHWTNTVLD